METAVFDAKPYDKEYLGAQAQKLSIKLRFIEARLSRGTAALAKGCAAVCLFVNDQADAKALAILKQQGVGLIALRCAGYNQVDLKIAEQLNIRVTRVPEYSPHAVAEHALALFLCLDRHLHRANNRVRESNFSISGLMGTDLYGKTVGIVGAGRIGKITALLFKGFGTKVLVYDPAKDIKWAKRHAIQYAPMKTLLQKADVISLHAPLTPKTFHLFDAQAFQLMKQGAFLINTSRGKLVDTAALIKALKMDKLGGVGLDVYEEEAGVFFEDFSNRVVEDDQLTRLLSFSKVLMTSHQGFFTKEAMHEIAKVTVGNIKRFEQGKAALKGSALNAL